MGRLDELVSAEFAAWEQRGRGWQVWPEPVRPEPPFQEFTGYRLATSQPVVDDGRRPGILASLFDSLESTLKPKPPVITEEEPEPEPTVTEKPLEVEFVASIPAKLDVPEQVMSAFVDALESCAEPTSFEILGSHEGVGIQFVSSESDAAKLQRHLTAFFPELLFTQSQAGLAEKWDANDGDGFIVDFGLAHEFMLPLQSDHAVDPFVGVVSVLNEMQADDLGLLQVLFQPVTNPWAGSAWRAVTDTDGKALFVNRLHLLTGAKEKLELPLFGVVVRVAAKAASFDRSSAIVRDMAYALRAFAKFEGNHLIPLHNNEYPFDAHEEDLLDRQSRRSGMLLNREELSGFVHFPSDEVRSPKLLRQSGRTKVAPQSVVYSNGLFLGLNEHAGLASQVRLNAEQRVRHCHIVGSSGTGKSTLLFSLIQQDILNGEGVAVLDPHGDLVERVLGIIPAQRIKDVVLLDPTDEDYSIGFNILSAHSDFEKTLLASDLVSVFRRLSSSWGDQLNSVLNNAILAFLESSQGGTLADLRRFLLDAEFRNEFLKTVRDPDIVYYWRKGFPQLGGNKSIGPVLTRLDTFLGPKPIRYMVSQPANRLDVANILDSGKIFLAKLPQGQIGKENSFLLGSLLVSKFQQLAMSRQRMSQADRRDFWLYIDEFHYFITPSMAEILSGARKYRLGLILAHHELHQLQRDSEVASAVMSHPYTRIVFRVGDSDAHVLEKGFASFAARDLQNLEIGHAVCRVERSDFDFNLRVPLPEQPAPSVASETRNRVVTASREKFASPRSEIEAALLRAAELGASPPEPKLKRTAVSRRVDESIVEPAAPPIVETRPVAPPAPIESVAPVPKPVLPPGEGIGGAQHQATQRRIKEAAEKLGFLAVIEKQISNGSVDLWLQRSGFAVACEISVTTTIDHEFKNVRKCLEVDCAQVAVISKPSRLEQIREAVLNGLGPEVSTRVGYYTPDDFIAWLTSLPTVATAPVANEPTVTIRRGRKVTRKTPALTTEERKQKEAERISLIAEVMQPRRPSS